MNSYTTLDYALFQLSPRRSHCELFAWSDGKTEKLASGLMKPFVTHLRVAEEQFSQAVPSIKLEVEKRRIGTAWFNKGTLERFVRFVSTPEVLELVNTFDAEMSQLEGARSIYSEGAGNPLSGTSGEDESAMTSTADITKKELLKAIDVRLLALKQDLAMACSRASSAGFTLDNISELLLFAQQFGAYRLNEACTKFLSLCQRRAELLTHHNHSPHTLHNQEQWKEPQDLSSSSSSDMSIDDPVLNATVKSTSINDPVRNATVKSTSISSKPTSMPSMTSLPTTQQKRLVEKDNKDSGESSGLNLTQPLSPPVGGTRRLSVQDRIKQFENKQKENPGGRGGGCGVNGGFKIGGRKELRRVSSEMSCSSEKSLLRRWSGTSDMSIDLNTSNSSFSGRKEVESVATTPSFNSQTLITASKNEEKDIVVSQPQSKSEDRPSSSSFLPQQQYEISSKENDSTETPGLRDNSPSSIQQGSLSGRNIFDSRSSRRAVVELTDQAVFQNQFGDSADLSNQTSARAHFKGISDKAGAWEKVPCGERKLSKALQVGVLSNKKKHVSSDCDVATPSTNLVQGSSSVARFRTERKNEDPESIEKVLPKPQSQSKEFSGKLEETSKGELDTSFVQSGSSLSKTKMRQEEHSRVTSSSRQGIKLHLQTSSPDKIRKPQDKREERKKPTTPLLVSTRRKAKASGEALDLASESLEPVHITKASKGALELNNELQMKADELEKLFSEHKLKVPGDNASAQRGNPADMRTYSFPKETGNRAEVVFPSHAPVRNDVSDGREFDMNVPMKMVGSSDYDYSSSHNHGYLNSLEDGRGKFYEMYMQKRDAKLREEWGSKRVQKEARMKAMQDSLEHSRDEMKVKFSRSADRSDSALFGRRYAEKIRTYNTRAVLRNKEKQKVDFLPSEEEEDDTTIF